MAVNVKIDMTKMAAIDKTLANPKTTYCTQYQQFNVAKPAKKKRTSKPLHRRSTTFESSLVVSNSASHVGTAKELCDSESSYGPSFVSTVDGQYCDMSSKTLWPVCTSSDSNDAACFDLADKKLRNADQLGKRDDGFTDIRTWDD